MLDRKLILMITDARNTRYFNIHVIFREILIYGFILFFVLIAYCIVSMITLHNSIDALTRANELFDRQYLKMMQKNEDLNTQMNIYNEEFDGLARKVISLESQVGMESQDIDSSQIEALNDRVDLALLSGAQKAFVMKFIPNGYPLKNGFRISAQFGYRMHPVFFTKHLHTGMDFAVSIGTPVYATADGVVEEASTAFNGGYGTLIRIDHSFGFRTYYAHLSKIIIEKGNFVKKGQIIGYAGNSGVSTGPHLHYEVRFLDKVLDPKNFVNWDIQNFSTIFDKERNVSWQSLVTTIENLMEQNTAMEELRG